MCNMVLGSMRFWKHEGRRGVLSRVEKMQAGARDQGTKLSEVPPLCQLSGRGQEAGIGASVL